MKIKWTEEESARLKELWFQPCSIKRHLPELGNRTYQQVIDHAKKVLKLPARPTPDRGLKEYVRSFLMAELGERPCSAWELMQATGFSRSAICRILKNSNPGPDGDIHIADWRRRSHGGTPVAVYAAGPGENAIQPAPHSLQYHMERQRERRRRKSNPFAGLVSQATGIERISTAPKKGAYGIRVFREAA